MIATLALSRFFEIVQPNVEVAVRATREDWNMDGVTKATNQGWAVFLPTSGGWR